MKPGKRFEAKFHKSLLLLPGASMRIEDGGAYAKNQQMGDFLFWPEVGSDTFLIECKATQGNFKFLNLRDAQLEELLRFDRLRESNHSVLAINYYGENIRADNVCVMVPIEGYLEWVGSCGMRSLSMDDAVRIGAACPMRPGNIWDLGGIIGLFQDRTE